jgi:hypothetical protein
MPDWVRRPTANQRRLAGDRNEVQNERGYLSYDANIVVPIAGDES